MDILYVIGDGSKYDNLELRMSLRSICKYGTNIGKIIIVGKPPKWLSKEAVCLEVEDKYHYKHQNILLCIEEAIDRGLVHGDFLYSSDDHFYVKNVDFNRYPYFVKGELRYTANPTDRFYQYHKSLCDTRRLCTKYGLPTLNYSQHCNTHMHTEVFKSIRHIIRESYKLPYGVEPTSIIMNAWQTWDNPPQVVERKDMKIMEAKSKEDILMQIGDRDCFSISDRAFQKGYLMQFFNDEYSIKTVFESD